MAGSKISFYLNIVCKNIVFDVGFNEKILNHFEGTKIVKSALLLKI